MVAVVVFFLATLVLIIALGQFSINIIARKQNNHMTVTRQKKRRHRSRMPVWICKVSMLWFLDYITFGALSWSFLITNMSFPINMISYNTCGSQNNIWSSSHEVLLLNTKQTSKNLWVLNNKWFMSLLSKSIAQKISTSLNSSEHVAHISPLPLNRSIRKNPAVGGGMSDFHLWIYYFDK